MPDDVPYGEATLNRNAFIMLCLMPMTYLNTNYTTFVSRWFAYL